MSRPVKSIPGRNPFHDGLKKQDLTCYFLQRDEYDMTKHYRNRVAFREGLTRLRCILGLRAYFCEEHRTPEFENFLHDWSALEEKYLNDPGTHRAWLRDPREHQPLLRDILYILLHHGPDIWPVRNPGIASDDYEWLFDAKQIRPGDPQNLHDFYRVNLIFRDPRRQVTWQYCWSVMLSSTQTTLLTLI